MATTRQPKKEEKPEAKRPVMNFGPYPTDRNTSIEVAVWQNEIEGSEGNFTTFNVTIKRSYRDESGAWHVNMNMRPHDLPVAVHALAKAHDFILEAKRPE